jgi:pyruvate formate lyase activating enzyme
LQTKRIYDITPFTLLDYPGKTACIAWFAGCNMRCAYCYNPQIVLGKGTLSDSDLLHFLSRRKGLLDAVVLSGGECTTYGQLPHLLGQIKEMGFLTKIDTNGLNTRMLQHIVAAGLADYIALDFKAPDQKFSSITGTGLFNKFTATLHYLLGTGLPFEVRTTVHTDLLTEDDINHMSHYLYEAGYRGTFFVQPFRKGSLTLSPIASYPRNLNPALLQQAPLKLEIRN